MKYIVTGGAGFIGSNITRKLLSLGEEVKVIDNFLTGTKENIADIAGSFELVEADIRDTECMKKEFAGWDVVLHQAAIPSVPRSIEDPVFTNDCNVNGSLSVLLASRDASIRRVVYAGSSSAYGNSQEDVKNETIFPSPLSPYAAQKLTGEYYCRVFSECFGLETVTLRYFNVFGPYQNPLSEYAAVIPKFITAMLRDEAPVIYGDGTQSRDFTFVENNVSANILAAQARSEDVSGKIFNIACGQSISLNELVEYLNNILGTRIEPLYTTARKGDVKNSLADIQNAEKYLGYKVVVPFKEGLEKTVGWYRRRRFL